MIGQTIRRKSVRLLSRGQERPPLQYTTRPRTRLLRRRRQHRQQPSSNKFTLQLVRVFGFERVVPGHAESGHANVTDGEPSLHFVMSGAVKNIGNADGGGGCRSL